MSENEKSEVIETNGASETGTAEAAPAAEPEPLASDILVERFEGELAAEGAPLFGRLGFGMYHSVGDELAQKIKLQMNPAPHDALDHYNVGVVQSAEEKFGEAAKSFERALKLKPDFGEALHNLALALECAGSIAAARKAWTQVLERVEDTDEAGEIKNHLTELANR